MLSRIVDRANEARDARGQGRLLPVVPPTLRRTSISVMLMFEAGAWLHYIISHNTKGTKFSTASQQDELSRPRDRAFAPTSDGRHLQWPQTGSFSLKR